jgi:methyl-accepting chemotaxis protein
MAFEAASPAHSTAISERTGTFPRLASRRFSSFAWKLRSVLGLLLLISVVGGGAMLLYARRNHTLVERLADSEMKGLGLVLNIDRDAYQAMLGLTKADAARTAEEREQWLAFFDENIGQTRDRLTTYLALPRLDPALRRAGQEAMTARDAMAKRGQAARGILTRGNTGSDIGTHEMLDTLQVLLDAFRVQLDRLETGHSADGDSLKALVLSGGRSAEHVGEILLFLLIATGLVGVSYLARTVTEPVTRVAASARRIASGDLTGTDITATSQDEVGEMATAFNRMTRDLRRVISEITAVARDLTTQSGTITALTVDTQAAVTQLGGAVQHIAAGTQEQAAALHQAFREAEQIDGAVSAIAADATHLAKTIDRSVSTARHGGETVSEILRANAAVNDLVTAHTTHVSELRRHSEEVADFVKTINAISHQTNLLALNAAIEAARAGDAGRGFEVVAAEIGTLAEDASAAAARTVRTVRAMQSAIEHAVAAIEHSAREVKHTTGRANEVGGALDNIFHALEECDEHVRTLSEQAGRITERVGETTAMLRNVVQVSEHNAAAAQQMSASAEQVGMATTRISQLAAGARDAQPESAERSLLVMARELDALVAAFRVGRAA